MIGPRWIVLGRHVFEIDGNSIPTGLRISMSRMTYVVWRVVGFLCRWSMLRRGCSKILSRLRGQYLAPIDYPVASLPDFRWAGEVVVWQRIDDRGAAVSSAVLPEAN